ncbi:class I SAM-dependent methyltransferase [Akkermansiaceae bacterium]|jgi:ubiquinone/menaquinone biosynthesis C-methylase UbiE|nr:class I SAM-dependent methyltransferase [Akkermansiaceae bacterium]MDA7935626.1 class I SAM-dependent methyltransferase [Akkermansiaceae bacterium]MDA9831022.1 class I SAM-dependent methyltransferase [Akkermansiaceae bacterium]MDB4464853.1 class I SAM-dependent methyltransferase [Akkermansiaceae bacterium]MDB4466334.1 class I SAM-dependent methyltransferase [bacterium]
MKLNLGCGNKRKDDFIGVDLYPCEAVDVTADLREPLPFDDNSVTEIWMDNVIEHIPDLPTFFDEVKRICKPGSKVTIITPHFASYASWRDPTHVHHLSYFSMDHFEKKLAAHYTGGGLKVVSRHLSFGGILGNIGRMIFKISPREYESNWCFIFRPSTLRYVVEVVE